MLNEVSIEIIRRCPNNCIYCSSLSDAKCSEIIEYEKFVSVVKDAADLGAKTICLSGGEPFLHPRIVDMTAYIKALGLQSLIFTSGIIINTQNEKDSLDKDVLKAISGVVTNLIFNIDAATPEIYDRIMGTNGCFEKMKQSVLDANGFSICTEAHFIPMKININEAANAVALCKEFGISKISFLRLVMHGRALQNELQLALSDEELTQLKYSLEALRKNNADAIRIGVPLSLDTSRAKCEAARGKLNINYDGKVFPCEVFKNERMICLNGLKPDSIYNSSLRDIYDNSKYLQQVRELFKDFSSAKHSETCIGQYLINNGECGIIKMTNKDRQLMKDCTLKERLKVFDKPADPEYPLDDEVVCIIKHLCDKISEKSDDFEIFKHRTAIIDPLWKMLIEKAIKCLRYFDKREPFKNSDKIKTPKAYGINELKAYYKQYTDFENILYGSNRYYRDHVVHVFRTWLAGVDLLTRNNGEYLKTISLYEKEFKVELNPVEKLSIWTLIALTHDLGYPLEKAKSIIDTTRSMVSIFITNPDISMDFSFHGVQNYMNDFIVRLMSSKMRKTKTLKYVARLQPKFYFKFQKSLERNSHGILSTLIIYKLLTYFLESDYSINEDYTFNINECRQFYIRREILRAIASHTCDDVYQLYMATFSFLLRICDDTQQWGRKNISELYVETSQKYKPAKIIFSIDKEKNPKKRKHICTIREEISLPGEPESVIELIKRMRKQSLTYVTIFRDGQDTILRDFSFERILLIKCDEKIEFTLTLKIPKDDASKLACEFKYSSYGFDNKEFGKDFFGRIKNLDPNESLKVFNNEETEADMDKPETWRKGTFAIQLLK